MKGQEVRYIRRWLGLTQAKFAHLVGIAPNTVARRERDERAVSESVARLIRLLPIMPKAQRRRGRS